MSSGQVPEMTRQGKWRRAYRRIIDSRQDIGLLLIAFAPLDFTLDHRPLQTTWPYLLAFAVVGLMLIALSILAEWRLPE
jgi:hypothetical protein